MRIHNKCTGIYGISISLWLLLILHRYDGISALSWLPLVVSIRPGSSSLLPRASHRPTPQIPDHQELPIDLPRRDDVLLALQAVRNACQAIAPLQPAEPVVSQRADADSSSNSDSLHVATKTDQSPVTVADLVAQAIVLRLINEIRPDDSMIAEETSATLLQDAALAQKVGNVIASLQANLENVSIEMVQRSIDLGQLYFLNRSNDAGDGSVNSVPLRLWCLDPIDGTKGFLRGRQKGGQYAVALALLEEGVPTIGILGCPNLCSEDGQRLGCIFVASRGGGCYQVPLDPAAGIIRKVTVSPADGSVFRPREGRFCVGMEQNISDAQGLLSGIVAQIQEGSDEDKDLRLQRIDSQAKYGVIARGSAEYYIRLPSPSYREWIWDHAAGFVVLTEAGGTVTDTQGDELDFVRAVGEGGGKLPLSRSGRGGILGSNGGIFHDALLGAFAKQRQLRKGDE